MIPTISLLFLSYANIELRTPPIRKKFVSKLEIKGAHPAYILRKILCWNLLMLHKKTWSQKFWLQVEEKDELR